MLYSAAKLALWLRTGAVTEWMRARDQGLLSSATRPKHVVDGRPPGHPLPGSGASEEPPAAWVSDPIGPEAGLPSAAGLLQRFAAWHEARRARVWGFVMAEMMREREDFRAALDDLRARLGVALATDALAAADAPSVGLPDLPLADSPDAGSSNADDGESFESPSPPSDDADAPLDASGFPIGSICAACAGVRPCGCPPELFR
ncbi:MAG: hypothetical protein Q8S13_09920 [Dehalococcoidia bacterium]|nr:hypothetical protein [Dehalococcoidia bacterium]